MNHCEQIAHRMINAQKGFVQLLQDLSGCTEEKARAVFALYLKNKLIKLDLSSQRYIAKHGAFLDKKVILNACDNA